MTSSRNFSSTKEILLLGGGHTHALVLKALKRNPIPGVRVVVISDSPYAAYSGMLPALVERQRSFSEAHIDIAALANCVDALFIEDSVIGLDADRSVVTLQKRGEVEGDVLSLNVGILSPVPIRIAQSGDVVSVKPVGPFLQWLATLEDSLRGTHKRIAVVGGGLAGIELILALEKRFRGRASFVLVERRSVLLEGMPLSAQRSLKEKLETNHIEHILDFEVVERREDKLLSATSAVIQSEFVVFASGAAPQPWLKDSNLQLSEHGHVAVSSALQSYSHPNIFASGDVADILNHPHPKAGVYAVRQAETLSENLSRYCSGRKLRDRRLQGDFLKLVGTADGQAVAIRSGYASRGKAWKNLKDFIDGRFMAQFERLRLPRVRSKMSPPMYCRGCGGKAGRQSLLSCFDKRLPLTDSAEFLVADGCTWVESLDFFTPFSEDFYQMAQIAFHHASSDLLVSGTTPSIAQTILMLPRLSDSLERRDIERFHLGALRAADEYGAKIVGGHSAVGNEPLVGFVVSGKKKLDHEARLGEKSYELLITRPLGSGLLFAAQDRHLTSGATMSLLNRELSRSQKAVLELSDGPDVTLLTDVTGFGLLGHLLNCFSDRSYSIRIFPHQVPCFPEVKRVARLGVRSSLHDKNLTTVLSRFPRAASIMRYPWLVDPQTAGPILLATTTGNSGDVLSKLRARGFPRAAVVGEVVSGPDELFLC